MKINITRSQVAQLYVELTSDNLKEVFIVEGDEVVDAPVETPEAAPEANAPETDAPASSGVSVAGTQAPVPNPESAPETDPVNG